MSLDLDEAWVRGARAVEAFECDAIFAIVRQPSGQSDAVPSALRAAAQELFEALGLAVPASGELPAAAVIGREASLIRYYQTLITILARAGAAEDLSQPFPYFAVQPSIRSSGASLTRFSWLDSIAETEAVLTALKDGPDALDGVLWDDVDQGWAARIFHRSGALVLVEWNWEDEADIPEATSFDAGPLAAQAAQALDRLTSIHDRLIEAFGHDYWSYAHLASASRPSTVRQFLGSLRLFGRTP